MHHADHLIPRKFERPAVVYSGGFGQTQARHCRKGPFANKITGGEERDGGLLTAFGNDGEPCPALLQVEDEVGGISLGKESLAALQLNYFPTKARAGQECGGIKCRARVVPCQEIASFRTVRFLCPVNARLPGTRPSVQQIPADRSITME